MGERRSEYKILVGKPKGGGQLEDLSLNGKILFEWILAK
jgi:hypothetical protein